MTTAGDGGERSLLDARLAHIQEGSDFPALSRQIIDTISLIDDDGSSLQRLANVVLREYSLTLSVVRTANTVHYRRTGRPIQSATHAMMMLGASTVRHLASSLLLFENYSKRSPVLRELMVLSLITANHAREVSARLSRGNPEEAHLCGMVRNLGEVLIACHFPDDYARIQERIHNGGQSLPGACHAVLGFRYEDLAVEVARHWGMPDVVVQGIRARVGASMSDTGAITAFSHDLTMAIYRRAPQSEGDDAAATGERAVHDVLERHALHVAITHDQAREAVEAALDETRELFSTARVPIDSKRLKALADASRLALGLSATPTGEWEIEAMADHDQLGSPALRRRLRQELESKVLSQGGADLGEVVLLALEGALRGGPFHRAIFCMLTPDRTRLTARSGLGAGVEALMTKFDFPMTNRGGPVVALVQQRQPTYVPVDRVPSPQDARWAQQLGIGQYGIFPLMVADRLVGCLYVDRAPREPVPDRVTREYTQSLSVLVEKALEARRAGATAKSSASSVASSVASSATATLTPDAKSALVLRVLRGEAVEVVAASAGVASTQLESWRVAFLEGAMARLGGAAGDPAAG